MSGVGEGVFHTCRGTPEGVIVFFPSYALLSRALQVWKEKRGAFLSIMDRIATIKEIHVEPKSKVELSSVRTRYQLSVRSGKGGVLLAVARGKISEGLDVSDEESRGVVIIGIPYPPYGDVRVQLKRGYLDDMAIRSGKGAKDEGVITGDSWYTSEGFRTTNQAIGRVLRHVKDYGVVVLLDSRYNTAACRNLPKWLQKSMEDVETTENIEEPLKKFFRNKRGEKIGDFSTVELGKRMKKKERISLSSIQPLQIEQIANELKDGHDNSPCTSTGITGLKRSAEEQTNQRIPMKKIRLKANGSIENNGKSNEKLKIPTDAVEKKVLLKTLLDEIEMKEDVMEWLKEYRQSNDTQSFLYKVKNFLLPRSTNATTVLKEYLNVDLQKEVDKLLNQRR